MLLLCSSYIIFDLIATLNPAVGSSDARPPSSGQYRGPSTPCAGEEPARGGGRRRRLGAAASGKASATSMAPASGLDGAGLSDTRNAGHPILPPPESSSVEWDAWAGSGNAAAIRMATRTAAVAAALLPTWAMGFLISGMRGSADRCSCGRTWRNLRRTIPFTKPRYL